VDLVSEDEVDLLGGGTYDLLRSQTLWRPSNNRGESSSSATATATAASRRRSTKMREMDVPDADHDRLKVTEDEVIVSCQYNISFSEADEMGQP
jgi:hypothetical protein